MIKAILQGQKPTASEVKFADGETFQEKLNSGELTGPAGAPGDTWVPTVSDEGELSWAKNSGGTPQNVNIKGPTGPAGTNGKDGSPGAVGPAGPNKVSTETSTDINGILKGNGSTVVQAKAGMDYIAPPKVLTVTLTTGGGTTQNVAASGVLADEEAQEIHIMPKASDMKAYMDAGAYCSGQGADRLTFTLSAAPASNITVYVTIWAVK